MFLLLIYSKGYLDYCSRCVLPAPGLTVLPVRSLQGAKVPPGAGLAHPACARVTLVGFSPLFL